MVRLPQSIRLDNLNDGETLHQRCLLVKGTLSSQDNGNGGFISIATADSFGNSTFPEQTWPVCERRFKALLLLTPGANSITVARCSTGQPDQSLKITLTYIPLLQVPPLHLAIMIAKDSPLLIDCPPRKHAGVSSAHADLDAAIAKLRMTAYMWQALTAEDMRSKGLSRRSFRLEEEWGADTLSNDFINAAHQSSLHNSAMRSTAKVHLIRSDKTVAQLRDEQFAQQNPGACRREQLFTFFLDALKKHGGPFESSAHPVVAGLILDSHYSLQQNLIVGHAALGCHNPTSISLGMFGSHLTWSWPRFMEEVSSCLLDTAPSGDLVGNDNGECGTAWEACSIGQGAFLHEVGHAFGASHTTGIMARGYAQDWPKSFLAQTAKGLHPNATGGPAHDTRNEVRWDLREALSFKLLPHFRLQMDSPVNEETRTAVPTIEISDKGLGLSIASAAGIARVEFRGIAEISPTVAAPVQTLVYSYEEIERRFHSAGPLDLSVIGMNGKEKTVRDVWRLFSSSSVIRIPGSSLVLNKRSVTSTEFEDDGRCKYWEWVAMLKERTADGKLTRANAFDMRVGCILDGGVLYYEDGHKTHLGPNWNPDGSDFHFGGHASKKIKLSPGVDIVKIEVKVDWDISGMRTHLSDGRVGGELNTEGDRRNVTVLKPNENERIIGFFGRSRYSSGCSPVQEFGIITAPKDVEIPDAVYDLQELKNTDGGLGGKPLRKGAKRSFDEYSEGVESDDNDGSDDETMDGNQY